MLPRRRLRHDYLRMPPPVLMIRLPPLYSAYLIGFALMPEDAARGWLSLLLRRR